MKNFFGNLRYRFQQGMQGRYGNDELNRFLSIAAIVLFIASFFSGFWAPLGYLWYVGLIFLIFEIFRSFSRNYAARERERDIYLNLGSKIRSFFSLQKRKWRERKTSAFFTCPKCRATVRVPRGKGNIQITCPKCRTQFVKRT